jgi:hypothetical protein
VLLLLVAVGLEATWLLLVLLMLLEATLAAHLAWLSLVVVVVTVSLVHVQLVLLEDELLLLEREHLRCVILVVVGDEAKAARVADLVGDDAGILDEAKVGEVVSQLVLGSLFKLKKKDCVN